MKHLALILFVLAMAAVGPNIFPAALAGFSTMPWLAARVLLPSIILLGLALILARRSPLGRTAVLGAAAGAIATIALEAVRLAGFHFDFMPGNLPQLMGVLLLDRFAEGPTTLSNLTGWAYHFWNGAAFGLIYTVLIGTQRRWVGAVYGLLLGIGFMVSPVVTSLGVGFFGLQFSYGFPVTVIIAHVAFGAALGFISHRFIGAQSSALLQEVRACFTRLRNPSSEIA